MQPVNLFYSYAHEDETLRDELAGHLKIMERRGVIRSWHDRCRAPGQNLWCSIMGVLASESGAPNESWPFVNVRSVKQSYRTNSFDLVSSALGIQ